MVLNLLQLGRPTKSSRIDTENETLQSVFPKSSCLLINLTASDLSCYKHTPSDY